MLRIGVVDYLNTIPLFLDMDEFTVKSVRGTPTFLIEKLRSGEIDGGIVSSVEYIINDNDYCILPGISISSKSNRICSVAIFSKKPLYKVDTIFITPESLTSRIFTIYLLEYIYGKPVFEVSEEEADALMLIGDRAIYEYYYGEWEYVYDLAHEWYKLFGLPFIFALFIFRKEVLLEKKREVALFKEHIFKSVQKFYKNMDNYINSINGISKDFLKYYFNECIEYGLSTEHIRSLSKLREIVSFYYSLSKRMQTCTLCL